MYVFVEKSSLNYRQNPPLSGANRPHSTVDMASDS